MKLSEFNTKIRQWLPASEYYEIYKINHPNENHNEVHFIQNGIRVCCVKDFKENYFYLNTEVYLVDSVEILTLKTGKYHLFDDKSDIELERIMKVMVKNKRKLEKRNVWNKFLRLLNYR